MCCLKWVSLQREPTAAAALRTDCGQLPVSASTSWWRWSYSVSQLYAATDWVDSWLATNCSGAWC